MAYDSSGSSASSHLAQLLTGASPAHSDSPELGGMMPGLKQDASTPTSQQSRCFDGSTPTGTVVKHDSKQMSTCPKTENTTEPFFCSAAGCGKRIFDRFLLRAMDKYWHEDCLKCACCQCRLGEVGSTLYYKNNMILCRRDYLRLFGMQGHCAACHKNIPAFEMVMRARNNVYHLECFACQECTHRFCVGDKYYLCDNKILCEYDYEERMVFAQMAYNYNSLAQLKRTFQSVDDMEQDVQAVPTQR